MKDNPKGLWFKRKLYGWGWVPVKWQGWLVILAFVGVLLLNGFYFASKVSYNEPSSGDLGLFFGVIVVSIILLLWIACKTGEKPGWRWGI